jgi:transcriptional regulator with XRE-family HTH domain
MEGMIMSSISNSKEIFSSNLKSYMKEKNINRKKLSEDLSIKYSTLCEWLKGTMMPRSDALDKIADYFGVTTADLLASDNEKETMYKAPIIIYLDETLSFDENLERKNYGYRICDKPNCFTVKLFGEIDSNAGFVTSGSTMVFERIKINNFNDLIANRSYYIRNNNNSGEIVRCIKVDTVVALAPYFNERHEYTPIILNDKSNIEIIGIATELITPV